MSCLMLLSVAWRKAQKAANQIDRGHRLGEKANTMGCWNQDTEMFRQLETGLRGVSVKSCTLQGWVVGMISRPGERYELKAVIYV